MKKIKGYKRDFAQAVRDAILEEEEEEFAEDTKSTVTSDSPVEEASDPIVEEENVSLAADDIKKKVDAHVDEVLGVQKRADMMPEIPEDLSKELSSDVETVEIKPEDEAEEASQDSSETVDSKPAQEKKEKKGKSKKMSEMEHEIKRE